jgi:acetyl esterase/lipase
MAMRKISLHLVLLFILFLFACKKDDVTNSTIAPLEIKEVSYGGGSLQKADVYLPANRSQASTKTIILIHGGSWIAGDKNDLNNVIPLLKSALPNAAFVNINYTLATGTDATRHPAQMNDLKTLLQFLNSKSAEWNIAQSWSMLGVSAGAHLGMLYAFSFDTEKQVKLVGTIVGPTNLTDPFYVSNPLFQSWMTSLLGKSFAQDPAYYQQLSPLFQVKSTAPPVYMAYGGFDQLVPTTNHTMLDTKLKELKVPYKYDYFPFEGHEFSNDATLKTIASFSQFWKQQVP